MIALHYSITKEDYVNFYTHVFWDAGNRKKKRLKNILKQAAYSVLFVVIIWYAGGFSRFNRLSIAVFILIFATSFLPFISGRSDMERQAEKIADDPDNASVFSELFLTATDAELVIRSANTESKYSWKAVIRKTETKGYFFLFISTVQALIIPKRIFGSDTEKKEFEKLLSRNISLEAEIKDDINAGE